MGRRSVCRSAAARQSGSSGIGNRSAARRHRQRRAIGSEPTAGDRRQRQRRQLSAAVTRLDGLSRSTTRRGLPRRSDSLDWPAGGPRHPGAAHCRHASFRSPAAARSGDRYAAARSRPRDVASGLAVDESVAGALRRHARRRRPRATPSRFDGASMRSRSGWPRRWTPRPHVWHQYPGDSAATNPVGRFTSPRRPFDGQGRPRRLGQAFDGLGQALHGFRQSPSMACSRTRCGAAGAERPVAVACRWA